MRRLIFATASTVYVTISPPAIPYTVTSGAPLRNLSGIGAHDTNMSRMIQSPTSANPIAGRRTWTEHGWLRRELDPQDEGDRLQGDGTGIGIAINNDATHLKGAAAHSGTLAMYPFLSYHASRLDKRALYRSEIGLRFYTLRLIGQHAISIIDARLISLRQSV